MSSSPARRKANILVALRPLVLAVVLVLLVLFERAGGLAHAELLPWVPKPTAQDAEAGWFVRCRGPLRYTCVVDGDTIHYKGETIRLAGFNTPEISEPACAQEKELGEQAANRLRELLNEGPFSLGKIYLGPDRDGYDRQLRELTREGRNIGDRLIASGLAEQYWGGQRGNWCD